MLHRFVVREPEEKICPFDVPQLPIIVGGGGGGVPGGVVVVVVVELPTPPHVPPLSRQALSVTLSSTLGSSS